MGRPIGFLTDLGLVDDAVGTCKGMMLAISPTSAIVDVTHAVPPYDVYEGACYLADAPEFFPDNAVFACVVYPQTGAAATIAARNRRGQILVGPDNGLFTLAADNCEILDVHVVQNPAVMRMPLSPSFYGRDVVVAAAAHLAAGVPLEWVGERRDGIERLAIERPRLLEDGALTGQVSIIDKNFGNVWTSIPESLCREAGFDLGDRLEVAMDGAQGVFPLVRTFADVLAGEPLAFYNSRGKLALARNQASLLELLPVEKGTLLRITRLADEQAPVSTAAELADAAAAGS